MDPAALLVDLGKAGAPHAAGLLKRIGRKQYDRFIATCTDVFADHVRTTLAKCAKVKSLLHRDQALNIRDQYVWLAFRTGSNMVRDGEILDRCKAHSTSLLVSGLAGSGKSMFMKWLTLSLVEAVPATQRIPIFVEMREVDPERLGLPLDQMIFQQASSDKSHATFNQFHVGLTHGMFTVVIDGLDEVPIRFRNSILLEISDFQRRFPDASIICSTRPNRSIESSAGLTVAHVQPMTLDQITQVIDRAVFDAVKKSYFIERLRDNLYSRHQSFLSNPLLATIMLITFDVSTEVPSRLSLFYSQVFEALFYKHDSSKGVYSREHYAKLEIDQFEAVLRALCFQSYANSKLSFEMSDLTDYVRKALRQTRLEQISPVDFIKDCMQSLSLMQEDGLYISFVHRSFQEYFTARFVLYHVGVHYYEILNGLAERTRSDSVLQMLCEMNPDAVLRGWVVPKIGELVSRLNLVDFDKPDAVLAALKYWSSAVTVDASNGDIRGWTFADNGGAYELHALNQVLAATGAGVRIHLFDGPMLTPWDPQAAEESDRRHHPVLRHGEPADFEEEPCLEFEFDSDAPSWIGTTNIPALLRNFRQSLLQARDALGRRFDVSDEFTKEVARLF